MKYFSASWVIQVGHRFSLLGMVLCLNFFTAESQNLVVNPSFEEYTSCPNNISQVDKLNDWVSYRPTPDYYNTCSSNSFATLPSNTGGYQCPSTGAGHCGLWVYHSSIGDLREFVGSSLGAPLTISQKYYVSIKVNLVDANRCGTNKLGVLFSTVSYSDTNLAPITNSAQIYALTPITDTSLWTTITGSFVADSAYQFIMVGNFFDDINTDTIQMDTSGSCLSYSCYAALSRFSDIGC